MNKKQLYYAKDMNGNFVQIESPYVYIRTDKGEIESMDKWPDVTKLINTMQSSFSLALRSVERVNRAVKVVWALAGVNILIIITLWLILFKFTA